MFKDEDEMLLSLATTSRVLAPTPTTQQKSMQTKLQTVAEILAESQDDGEWERLDNRAIEAAKWTDAEIARGNCLFSTLLLLFFIPHLWMRSKRYRCAECVVLWHGAMLE